MTLHLKGPVLVGADDVRPEAWVLDGRVTYDRPSSEATTVEGFVLPGLVDAHCHIGLGTHGQVTADVAEQQALTDRDAGALTCATLGLPPTPDGSMTARISRCWCGPAGTSPEPGGTCATSARRSSPTGWSRRYVDRPPEATAG